MDVWLVGLCNYVSVTEKPACTHNENSFKRYNLDFRFKIQQK